MVGLPLEILIQTSFYGNSYPDLLLTCVLVKCTNFSNLVYAVNL